MQIKIGTVLVLEVLSSVTEVTTSQLPVVPFCFGDDCYIMPEHFRRSWNDAQQMCRKYNSTLPIVDSPDRQRSFLAAVYNFNLNDTENVWLGAYSSDSGVANWRWLDGSRFFGSGMLLNGQTMFSRNASSTFQVNFVS